MDRRINGVRLGRLGLALDRDLSGVDLWEQSRKLVISIREQLLAPGMIEIQRLGDWSIANRPHSFQFVPGLLKSIWMHGEYGRGCRHRRSQMLTHGQEVLEGYFACMEGQSRAIDIWGEGSPIALWLGGVRHDVHHMAPVRFDVMA